MGNLDKWKKLIKKFPHPRSEELSDFKKLFLSLSQFGKSVRSGNPDESLKHKYLYHFDMLWKHLLNEFIDRLWYYDEHGCDEASYAKYASGPITITHLKFLLRQAVKSNEVKPFFKAYPYVIDLLMVDDYFSANAAG